MPPNHVSAPALSLANLASVVVAAQQKRLVPQLTSPLLPARVVNGARPFPAEALARPHGTLTGTLTVLPPLRMGLAQMAAPGRPTPAALIAMPVVPHMQHPPHAAAQAPAPSKAAPHNAAACQQVWERIRAVRADWMLRDTGQHPAQQGLNAKDNGAARQSSTEALEAADRVRAVRKLWHGREAEQLTAASPPSQQRPTVSMPQPSAVLLQTMALHRSRSPDPARLEDLLRGLIPKPSEMIPHPPHKYPTLPQRSEFHLFGIKRALDRLRG
ncbi:hypothetical protein [Stenotrophomonas sp. CFBP 13725]|uniref:hypothetical protein n=1 Tax=Stenotrophomonas sp. CFBP 13725 TaxID=2775297 RepID=UPI00177CAE92|nr:hypothetical protein [Stenotrophomonas sp. CFBP 13725]MBD8635957.1 hypothetical protein [Stenotrophomonas sp. CFBP 13725]